MKIALVIYRFSERGGGVEGYVARLARGLAARGHGVHLFAHEFQPGVPRDFPSHTVPAVSFYSPWRDLSFARNAAALLQADPSFDIINGFGRTIYQDVYRVGSGCHWEYLKRTKRGMNNPLVAALHRCNPRNAAILYLERKTYSPAGHRIVVCNSQSGKEELLRYFSLAEERIRVVYNSVDSQRFHPDQRQRWREEYRNRCQAMAGEALGLFVGPGTSRKGLDLAIHALAQARKSHPVRLAVLGEVGESYAGLAERLGLPVTLLGYQKEVERYHAAADFFILPTRYDAFANACLEAMASGLPVITTRESGVAEIMEDGVDGLIVESPEDIGEIGKKVGAALDAGRREALGRAARAKAAAFTEKRNLDELEAIYRGILEQKK